MTFPMKGDSFFKGCLGADMPAGTLTWFSKVICRRHFYFTWVSIIETFPSCLSLGERREKEQPRLDVFSSFLFIFTFNNLSLPSSYLFSVPPRFCHVSSDFLDVFLLPNAEYCTEQNKMFHPFP